MEKGIIAILAVLLIFVTWHDIQVIREARLNAELRDEIEAVRLQIDRICELKRDEPRCVQFESSPKSTLQI